LSGLGRWPEYIGSLIKILLKTFDFQRLGQLAIFDKFCIKLVFATWPLFVLHRRFVFSVAVLNDAELKVCDMILIYIYIYIYGFNKISGRIWPTTQITQYGGFAIRF
jgi:hypothetical protein